MAELEIRPLLMTDVALLVELDHSYHTESVWQMEFQSEPREVLARFREVRLPRSMRVEYPRPAAALADDWRTRPGLLVAQQDEDVLGYISLTGAALPGAALATDLVVGRRFRRQGVGSALVRAGQTWASQEGLARLVLEMQSKNYPAIALAVRLGFEFCGFNDRYYSNQDIAVFFARNVT